MTEKSKTNIAVGDRVSHSLFGEGFAKEVTRSGNGRDIHIYCEFDEAYQRSESLPPTRFRKIISTFLTRLDWEEVVENDNSVNDIVISGLEGSGLVKFDFSDSDTESYEPTAEDKQAVADEDNEDSLEDVDV